MMGDEVIMEEEKWRSLEEGIAKAKVILDGYPVNAVFSVEEYIHYYDCVYHLLSCPSQLPYYRKLLDRFKKALEESIVSKVLPSLVDKNGAPLLVELLHLWTNYKIMAKCLRGFFQYLDRQTIQRTNNPPLSDISISSFRELVCKVLHKRLTNTTVFLITQDRDGVPVDRNLLQGIARFYVEAGEQGKASYYGMLEEAILVDAATYYSQVASQWYPGYSSTNYVLKVEQCLVEEKRRASVFLHQSSVEKLLQALHSQLLEQYADKLTEKQKTENMNQDIISRCSNLRLGWGSLAKFWSYWTNIIYKKVFFRGSLSMKNQICCAMLH